MSRPQPCCKGESWWVRNPKCRTHTHKKKNNKGRRLVESPLYRTNAARWWRGKIKADSAKKEVTCTNKTNDWWAKTIQDNPSRHWVRRGGSADPLQLLPTLQNHTTNLDSFPDFFVTPYRFGISFIKTRKAGIDIPSRRTPLSSRKQNTVTAKWFFF